MDRTRLNVIGMGMIGLLLTAGGGREAGAQEVGFLGTLEFDTELTSLELESVPVALPLASDPENALGDSIDGYGFVNSLVHITLSSQRMLDPLVPPGPASVGKAFASPFAPALTSFLLTTGEPALDPINPAEADGQEFFVSSFFDVFFDIAVADIDNRPGRDFIGLPDGTSVPIFDNGPAHMENFYSVIFDADAPNFGLIPPPESAPYIGHFNIEIPLFIDINGNGENDKLKFILATHAVGDENRTFIQLPDGSVLDMFDSTAAIDGAIVDESSDPPFSISLTGPTTAQSRLLNQVVPEPSTWVLAASAAAGLPLLARRRSRRNASEGR